MEYKEIFELKDKLEKEEIPFTFEEAFGGYHLCYPSNVEKDCVCSVIEHDYSYGKDADLLEIMGLLSFETDDENEVEGCLTAEDVFERIKKHYNKRETDGK